jgi:hypothetical protein
MPYGKNKVLLGVDSSDLTSNPQLVDGYRQLSISIQTSSTSAGNVLVYGANADGLGSALTEGNWSLVTTIPQAGIYTVDPGMRWLRSTRTTIFAGSAASNATIILQANVT